MQDIARYTTQAKAIGYRNWVSIEDVNYIDLRVKLIREDVDYWLQFADKERLEKGIPHIAFKNPPFCKDCGAWLNPDGSCPFCAVECV